MSFLQKWRIER